MNSDKGKEFIEKSFEAFTKQLAGDCGSADAYMLNACSAMYRATGDERCKQTVVAYLDRAVAEDGTVEGFADGRLSSVSIGVPCIFAFDVTGDEKYKRAAIWINGKLKEMPRCNSVFVYDSAKKDTISLSGYYEAVVFYMLYETRFGGKEHYNDVLVQFRQARTLIFDEVKEIYHSGLENGAQQGYAVYAQAGMMMAIIDTLSVMDQPIYEYYNELKELFKEAVHGLLPYQKPENHFFVDGIVTGHQKPEGCFACTAKITYALLKGSRLKAILAEKYDECVEATFESLADFAAEHTGESLTAEQTASFMLAYAEYVMR